MILLGVINNTSYPYRYFIADTELDRTTHPYENIGVALHQYIKPVFASNRYSTQALTAFTAYDITALRLYSVDVAKKDIYTKYPELLL